MSGVAEREKEQRTWKKDIEGRKEGLGIQTLVILHCNEIQPLPFLLLAYRSLPPNLVT